MAVLCINRFNQSTIIEYATLSLATHPLTLDFINIYSICVVMPAPRIRLTRRSPGLGNYIIEMSIILISHSSSGASINHVWLSALGKCHFSGTPSCCQHLRGSKWGLDVYRGWDTDDICTHIYICPSWVAPVNSVERWAGSWETLFSGRTDDVCQH